MRPKCLLVVSTVALAACAGRDADHEARVNATTRSATTRSESPRESPARRVDLTDNAAVERLAIECLRAYRDKDFERLAVLGPPRAQEKVVFLEPRNPNYTILAGDDTWRMRSLRAWSEGPNAGKLTMLSRGLDDVARGWYHADDAWRYAVELRKIDDKWTFFDLVQVAQTGAASSR